MNSISYNMYSTIDLGSVILEQDTGSSRQPAGTTRVARSACNATIALLQNGNSRGYRKTGCHHGRGSRDKRCSPGDGDSTEALATRCRAIINFDQSLNFSYHGPERVLRSTDFIVSVYITHMSDSILRTLLGKLHAGSTLTTNIASTLTATATSVPLTGTLTAIAASIGSVTKLAIDTSGNATTPGTVTALQVTGSNISIAGSLTLGSRIAAKLPQVQAQQVFGPFTGGTNTSFVFLGGTQLWQVSANVYCTSSASSKTTFHASQVDGATPTGSGSNVCLFLRQHNGPNS